jgi:hypothetical protein
MRQAAATIQSAILPKAALKASMARLTASRKRIDPSFVAE